MKKEKKAKKKGGCLSKIILIIVIFGVIGMFGDSDTTAPESANAPAATVQQKSEPAVEPTATPIPTSTPVPTPTPTPIPAEMQVDMAIKSVYKKDNELIDASCVDGIMLIDVQLQDNLSNKYIRIGYMSDAFDVLEKLQALAKDGITDFSKVCIAAYGTFVDIYGNESSKVAMSCTLSIDTLNKINFANATYSNLPKIADSYYIHPSLAD